jgi:hypothetical protein
MHVRVSVDPLSSGGGAPLTPLTPKLPTKCVKSATVISVAARQPVGALSIIQFATVRRPDHQRVEIKSLGPVPTAAWTSQNGIVITSYDKCNCVC